MAWLAKKSLINHFTGEQFQDHTNINIDSLLCCINLWNTISETLLERPVKNKDTDSALIATLSR